MKTLTSIFDESRDQIKKTLGHNSNIDDLLKEVRAFLDVAVIKYQQDKDSKQRSVLPLLMDMLKSSINIITSIRKVDYYKVRGLENSKYRNWYLEISDKWIMMLRVLVIFILMFVSFFDKSLFCFVLVVFLAALEFFSFYKYRNMSLDSDSLKSYGNEFEIDVDDYLFNLSDTLLTVDKVISEIMNIRDMLDTGAKFEEDTIVIDLFQGLLEAKQNEDADFALRQTKTIPFILRKYDMDIELYDGTNDHLFDFVSSLNPKDKDIQTVKPAIVKNDRILKRGLVTEPIS